MTQHTYIAGKTVLEQFKAGKVAVYWEGHYFDDNMKEHPSVFFSVDYDTLKELVKEIVNDNYE